MSSHDSAEGHADEHHAHEHHVTSLAVLFATFAALVALTFLTSALAYVNLGRIDIWITLGIATVKASLVALIFMHLMHDKAFNGIILVGTLGFATLFVCIALMDTTEYQPQIEAYTTTEKQIQAEMAAP